jgi:hypothetical protein
MPYGEFHAFAGSGQLRQLWEPYPCRTWPCVRYEMLPAASPMLPGLPGPGQKTAPNDRHKPLIFLMKFGAGEGIRTLDPNLGKVVLYP